MTLSPFLLVMHDIPALVMWFAGSNALMLGMVNLPTLATPQKQTTRHAKKGSVKGVVKVQLGLEKGKGVWGEGFMLRAFERRGSKASCIFNDCFAKGGWVYVPWPPV